MYKTSLTNLTLLINNTIYQKKLHAKTLQIYYIFVTYLRKTKEFRYYFQNSLYLE
jgi:hypothetical protein